MFLDHFGLLGKLFIRYHIHIFISIPLFIYTRGHISIISNTVTDIPVAERQGLRDDYLATPLRFFSLVKPF